MNSLKRALRRFRVDKPTASFIRHNRAKWRRDPNEEKKRVVLVDLFDSNPEIYCFSYMANYLAEKTDSCIRSYVFSRGVFDRLGFSQRRLENVYESFGAKLALSYKLEAPHRKAGRDFANKTVAALKTKWDVVNLAIEGVVVGPLVYDSYLKLGKFTLDLKDPELKETIYKTYVTFRICKDYFENHDVRALILTHYVYISHGIIRKVAAAFGVPVFFVMDNGDLQIRKIEPEWYYQLRYNDYRTLFEKLPDQMKPAYREQARSLLSARLEGKLDPGISYMISKGEASTGYREASTNRLLKESPKPKILIMLHCFFDSPHGYGWILFPDFWEWITFLLDAASKTEFEWYVKPHPGWRPENEILFEEIKRRYPKIHFLNRTASNKQLIAEGIKSLFTIYGTAGHEFAYLGVPVVNAGDNPHITYDFNLHPATIEEYNDCIQNADRLHSRVNLDPSKIEEYFYMRYFWEYPKNEFGARCIDESLAPSKIGWDKTSLSSTLEAYVKTETEEKDQKLRKYFDHFFAPYLSKTTCPPTRVDLESGREVLP